jgi:hypothetical protein
MADTENVSLNLTGTFAAMAEKDAEAAEKLAAKLDNLNAAGAKSPKTKRGDVDAQVKEFKKAADEHAKYVEDWAKHDKMLAAESKNAFGGLSKEFSSLGEGAMGALGPFAAGIGVTVGVIYKARAAFREFRDEMAAEAVAYATLGGSLVVEGTSAKESFVAAMEGMGKTSKQASILYKQIAHEAIETGRSKEEIAGEFKRLSNAGYKASELESLSKMLGDLKSTAGEGAASKVEKAIEKVKAKGSLDKGAVQALVKAGVSQQALYAELAKALHKPVGDIPGLIKTGKIDADKSIEAIVKTVEGKVGGAAAKQAGTILSLIARVKTAALELFVFDEKSVAPLKDALKGTLGVLTGSVGKQIKSELEGVGKEAFGAIFGELNEATAGDAGKAIVEMLREVKAAIRDVKPEVKELVQEFRELLRSGELKGLAVFAKVAVQAEISKLREQMREADDKLRMLKFLQDHGFGNGKGEGIRPTGPTVKNPITGKPIEVGNEAGPEFAKKLPGNDNDAMGPEMPAPDLGGVANDNRVGGAETGQAIDDGMIEGIEGGSDEVAAAARAMAARALEEAKNELGVHSPSEEFKEVGGFSDEGLAKGMGGGKAKAAAASMAGGALGAAQAATAGAGAGAGGGASGGGGGGVSFTITVNGGATQAQAEMVKKAGAELLTQWQAMQRRSGRDAAEGRS